MAAEAKRESELEIAYVLIDIVGYSKLVTSEQRRLLEFLNQLNHVSPARTIGACAIPSYLRDFVIAQCGLHESTSTALHLARKVLPANE